MKDTPTTYAINPEQKANITVTLTFSGTVHRVSDSTVELSFPCSTAPMFNNDFIDHLNHQFGEIKANEIMEEMHNQFLLKQITSGIKIK